MIAIRWAQHHLLRIYLGCCGAILLFFFVTAYVHFMNGTSATLSYLPLYDSVCMAARGRHLHQKFRELSRLHLEVEYSGACSSFFLFGRQH